MLVYGLCVLCSGGGFGFQKKALEVQMFILAFQANVELKENDVFVLFLPMYLLLGVVLSQIGCSFPIEN